MPTKKYKYGTSLLLAAIVGAAVNNASADSITGWGLETGFQNATLTEGSAGSFTTASTTGNAVPRALFSAIDFSIVGASLEFSGTASLPNFNGGNQQLRFGLFDAASGTGTLSSGNWTGATPSGWLGYQVQVGNSTGNTPLKGSSSSSGLEVGNGGTYIVNSSTESVDPLGGDYSFDISLTRISATDVSISYNVQQTSGGSYATSGSFTDSGGASSGVSSFNCAAFLLNTGTGNGSFSGLQIVSPVPEPSVAALLGAGIFGLVLVGRRRTIKS